MEEAWANFFSAQVGASSALLGLLFVGVSLNLPKILASPGLPNRALLALILLLIVLILSLIFLVPNQGLRLLAVEVLFFAVLMLAVGTAIEISLTKAARVLRKAYLLNFVLFELSALPYLVAGVLLAMGDAAGVYWLAAGMILSIVKAVTEAWVLLVEINR
ncbi:hypothetical protein ABLE91_15505 [Aquabacter sp. CN5-332]|uniref:hypothetical protein n=1 Tax=Aquabacter sp. CN5-332 TaxID=3156608 RepID=UPI0032B3A5DA